MTSPLSLERMAFVRLDDEKERVHISFKYKSEFVADRMFTMNRGQQEALEITLSKLRKNIETVAEKKLKRKKSAAVLEAARAAILGLKLTVEDKDGEALEDFMSIKEAFSTGNVLNIGTLKLPIVVNAPSIQRISLPKIMMDGFPVQAYVDLQNATMADCVFSWWKNSVKGETFIDYEEDEIVKENSGFTWLKIRGESAKVYTPRKDDVGKRIRVVCEPRDGEVKGVEIDAKSDGVVQPSPENCLFEDRHKYTSKIAADNEIRVVTYNLLADIYAHTEYSKTVLFKYCPGYALDFEYRKHMLVKEILGYNGDILCLQEVDRGMYKHELYPILGLAGFQGVYNEKNGSSTEGVSCFFRQSKFDLVTTNSTAVSEAVQTEDCLLDIREAASGNSELQTRLTARTQVLQRVLLRHRLSGKLILVCNTHLYFHPDADHIRLLQAYACCKLAEDLMDQREKEDGRRPSLIFCGDFNSCPEFGVYQLFTTGEVAKDCADWKSKEEETVKGLTARISRPLRSACGTPKYTNYTPEFVGCLDYIFYTPEDLVVTEVLPQPDHEVIATSEYTAIPSPLCPSDHLAQVATLTFRDDTAK